jgi:prepilin-type N-terminal cleavage/methylation domain-containing protein
MPNSYVRRRAFTMTELLVVIGIILILMSVLLPVVSKIRYASYTADTENEISQISNACNQYFSTFNAYPGPLSNDYIEGTTASPPGAPRALTPHPLEGYNPAIASGWAAIPGSPFPITGTENLVLGLMGGLRLDTGVGRVDSSMSASSPIPYVLTFAPTEVGSGPLNLNSSFPGRTASFLPNGSTYLMWSEATTGGQPFQTTTYQAANTAGTLLNPVPFTDPAGTQSDDSPIPEFVDRFPSPGPLPILYLRARTGAKGVVSDGIILDPTTGNQALYQYDVREIAAYTVPNASGKCIGLGPNSAVIANQNLRGQHNLQGLPPKGAAAILSSAGPPPVYYTVKDHIPLNAGPYFFNSSITPTNTSTDQYVNNTGRPRAVDQFILISAGPDGIYGTADDITSFGSVSQ